MVRKKKKKLFDKEKKHINRYTNFKTSYTTVKTSLKSIIKDVSVIEKINEAVIRTNKIIIHTYNFLKLYCLYNLDQNDQLPIINKKLINTISKVLCEENAKGRKPTDETSKLKNTLTKFYNEHYKSLIFNEEVLTYTHLNTVLDYESVNMITVIQNHIQNHFYDFFNRYINVITHSQKKIDSIKKNNDLNKGQKELQVKEHRSDIRKLKKDLLNNENNCKNKYDNIKIKVRNTLFPKLKNKDTIMTIVNKNPINVLKTLIKMSVEIENKHEKTFGCFPLRKNIIPKYITIDTTTVVHLLLGQNINGKTRNEITRNGNIISMRDKIWSTIFKIDKKVFNNYSNKRNKYKVIFDTNYVFNNQISTNGVSCSILQIRQDLYDPFRAVKIKNVKKPKEYRSEKYIDDFTNEEKEQYKNYNIVGIDPGKEDLIYATNGYTIQTEKGKHKTTTFRYSQNQRRKETKSKKYMKILDNDKKETLTLLNKSVKKVESELSIYNGKSCIYNNVKRYIEAKNMTNYYLMSYYEKYLYRKLKWYSYINKQKSEAIMINNFKKKFGDKDNTLVCFGDWEQKKHMKFKEPTIGKGTRTIFRKAGYIVPLVYEGNTSAKSFLNGKETEKFRRRRNPRPWKTDIKLWHGLLRFNTAPNNEPSKYILVNRDFNGSMNIRKIAVCHLNNEDRPAYLCKLSA